MMPRKLISRNPNVQNPASRPVLWYRYRHSIDTGVPGYSSTYPSVRLVSISLWGGNRPGASPEEVYFSYDAYRYFKNILYPLLHIAIIDIDYISKAIACTRVLNRMSQSRAASQEKEGKPRRVSLKHVSFRKEGFLLRM